MAVKTLIKAHIKTLARSLSKRRRRRAKASAKLLMEPVFRGFGRQMTTAAQTATTGTARWADALLLSFAHAGYVRAEPAILQRAEPFLDLSGEDIRKSLYLTTDATGEELCLRPDLTIPVACDYLASGRAGKPAGFS